MTASRTRRSIFGTLPDAGLAETTMPRAHCAAELAWRLREVHDRSEVYSERWTPPRGIADGGHRPGPDGEWSPHVDSSGAGQPAGPRGPAQILLPRTPGRPHSRPD